MSQFFYFQKTDSIKIRKGKNIDTTSVVHQLGIKKLAEKHFVTGALEAGGPSVIVEQKLQIFMNYQNGLTAGWESVFCSYSFSGIYTQRKNCWSGKLVTFDLVPKKDLA